MSNSENHPVVICELGAKTEEEIYPTVLKNFILFYFWILTRLKH